MCDITVIMPVFNGENFVRKAINSVILQNMNLEIIVVDDCSSDNSVQVIESCMQNSSAVKINLVKLEKNMGVSYCRNLAINMANTKYIAFLDCDDVWKKGKLMAQLEVMENTNALVCCTARELVDSNGNALHKIISVAENISYKSLLRHNSIALSSAMVKTEVAKEFLMGDENLHEDYIFWLNILKKYGNAKGINKSYLKYTVDENSKSGNKLKSAKMHYKSLLAHGINPIKALCLFIVYAIKGIMKHKL